MGRYLRSKIVWLVIGAAILGMAAVATWLVLSSRAVAVQIPQSVIDKTLFDIYVPASLPSGYTVSDGSFANNDGILVFALQNSQGHSVAITEQSVPSSFDFTGFYNAQIRDPKKVTGQFESIVGRVVGAGSTGTSILSVRADSTWVIATSQNAPQSDLEYLATHLRKFN